MNTLTRYIGMCILLLIGGCTCNVSNETYKIVHVKENKTKSIEINDFIDGLKYIAIRSHDDVLIGAPQKVLYRDTVIFMSDNKGIYQISTEGMIINSLERYGRGPNEYLGILDFTVTDKYLLVLDNNRKLLKYTRKGEYVSSSTIDFFPASVHALDQTSILLTSAYQSDTEKFHILDMENFSEKSSFQKINKSELTWRHIRGQSNFYEFGNMLLFHEPMNDTVYSICGNAYTPVLRIELYGKNPPDSFWSRKYSSVYDINQEAVKEKFCFGIPVYAESEDNIIFTYRDADKYLLCQFDKGTGGSRQSDKLTFPDIGVTCDIADIVFGFHNEPNQAIVLPGENIPPEVRNRLLHVEGEYDNPIICLGHMK